MKMYTDEEMLEKFSKINGLEPLGHFAIVQVLPVKETIGEGKIVVNYGETHKREQGGMDMGIVLSIGNLAFNGAGEMKPEQAQDQWGIKVGDVVELNSRYNHKIPRLHEYYESFKNLRIITDDELCAKGVTSE